MTMNKWEQILITAIMMCLLWQWLLPYEKLTSKIILTSLVACIRTVWKKSLSSASLSMYCVLCYRLKIIYKTQRIIKQSTCATEHACLQFSPKRHSSIWTLQEFRSCVFMLWEATEGLSAAVSPQKTKRADKVKRKASLLFHIIVSGRNNCLRLL